MSIQPNAWGINKVVKEKENKDEYKPDERIKRIYEAKSKFEKEQRHETFQNWLRECTDQNIQIKDILNHLCRDVFATINESGFTIQNEKLLRDEIATFIYKESIVNAKKKRYF